MTRPGLAAATDVVPEIALTLGAFDLVGAGDSWWCEALADVTDLAGNPQPVEVAVQTLIQDGSVSYTEKYDNATIPIKVCLSGQDAQALDDGAAALFAELGKPNVLAYTGPLAVDPVAWDVVNSRLERNSDDLEEVRGKRYYTITLTVLPFRRATAETITAALPIPDSATSTLIDNGSSATGWTGIVLSGSSSTTVTPTSSGGAVHLELDFGGDVTSPKVMTLTRAGTIDTSTLNLIAVDWQVAEALSSTLYALTGTGTFLAPVAERGLSNGYNRTWFHAGASSLAGLRFSVAFTGVHLSSITGLTSPVTFSIDNIAKTDTPPILGAGQQLLRTIEIDGSARTPGAIAIEHESDALGDVLAYFWAADHSGYYPPLRGWRVSGGSVTSDSDMVSGAHESLDSTTVTFEVPAARLPTDGYLLAARLGGGVTTGMVTWTATTVIGTADLGPTLTGSQSVTTNGVSATEYDIFALGTLQLPTRDLDEAPAGAVVRITLTADAAILLDEAWLFRDAGQLIQADCETDTPTAGGPSNRLFIEPASLTRPRPVVRRGHAADRSDSFHPPALGSWEFPEFTPPRVHVFTVTTGTTNASVSFRHYKRLAG